MIRDKLCSLLDSLLPFWLPNFLSIYIQPELVVQGDVKALSDNTSLCCPSGFCIDCLFVLNASKHFCCQALNKKETHNVAHYDH